MGEHAAYWTELAGKGTALLFGPVLDPKGVWGVGILAVEDEQALEALTTNDPAVKSGLGLRYEILPMARVVLGRAPA
jgi:uncharacterized protein YciI